MQPIISMPHSTIPPETTVQRVLDGKKAEALALHRRVIHKLEHGNPGRIIDSHQRSLLDAYHAAMMEMVE